jgi:hypothetical protein
VPETRDAYPFTNCIKKRSNCWTIYQKRAVRHLEKGRIVILEPEPETILHWYSSCFAWCRNSCRRDFERNTSTAFMIQILKKNADNLIFFLLTT